MALPPAAWKGRPLRRSGHPIAMWVGKVTPRVAVRRDPRSLKAGRRMKASRSLSGGAPTAGRILLPMRRRGFVVCPRGSLRHFTQFSPTWHIFSACKWLGAPRPPCALARGSAVLLNRLVHGRGDNTVCPRRFNVSFLLRVSKGRGALYGWASHSPHHRWEMLDPGHGEH